MRSLSILSVLALAACASAISRRETCSTVADCSGITSCGTAGSLICDNGQCTCTNVCDPDQDLAKCSNRNQCLARFLDGDISCNCARPWRSFHCIDSYCHCGYPTSRK
ncbi:uncharacterized protein LOC124132377 [Haliotis rufescens]|uniref:uncharacterized protein LOC124132377 n=1 Tax=Haliotis rufescens TaxID=6454 RepID=UPI001EAFCB76|nr:uncharacterized protein LOC124132377 [Haliotis rufescens]